MLTPYAAGSVGKELRRLGDGAVTTWPARWSGKSWSISTAGRA
ncbi:hypothetical protein HMPREF9609_02044 [Cutibacterium acnes HL027PA1]|nr:hypothetical protein HMPREF9609_02044 [Cutibacterium acnes HL027PA1]